MTISASLAENGLYDSVRHSTYPVHRTEYSMMVYGDPIQRGTRVTISASLDENGLYDFVRSHTDSIPRTEYSVMVYGDNVRRGTSRTVKSRRGSPRSLIPYGHTRIVVPIRTSCTVKSRRGSPRFHARLILAIFCTFLLYGVVISHVQSQSRRAQPRS